MTRSPSHPFSSLLVAALLAIAGCDRAAAPGTGSAPTTGSTVQATPPTASASTPLPVSPSGMTNSSTAGTGNDLSNSTRASGGSNVYQPPSSDNPPPGGMPAAVTGSAASTASQSVSSQTKGTSPPPASGTLPKGTEGSTGTRSGGGKS